jgi:hypothetical protein
VVIDFTLDKLILKEAAEGNFSVQRAATDGAPLLRGAEHRGTTGLSGAGLPALHAMVSAY